MHELSLCQALLRQVLEVSVAHGNARLRRIQLRMGPLCGAEPALMQSAFPLAAINTLAECAELVIEQTPLQVLCLNCHNTGPATASHLRCAHCHSELTQLLSGDELLVVGVDLVLT